MSIPEAERAAPHHMQYKRSKIYPKFTFALTHLHAVLIIACAHPRELG
jgi:hypothetical protein